MNRQTAVLWLTIGSLTACVAGCGKTEDTPPPPKAAETQPKAEAAKPVPAAQPQSQPLVSASATNEVMKVPVETVTKPAEPAGALGKLGAPKAAETTSSVAVASARSSNQAAPTTAILATLSQDQMVQGLQQALGKGLQQAIARLGHDGGFLTNLNVKIPMPQKLQKAESVLRAMKQDQLADDFVATMNHAAEQAVPEAGTVFVDALKQMTIEDAKSILTGPNDAATQYFQRTTQTNLYAKFYPIVQQATQKTGVTAAYKKLTEKANRQCQTAHPEAGQPGQRTWRLTPGQGLAGPGRLCDQ